VIFAIFCADDFSSLLRHLDKKRQKTFLNRRSRRSQRVTLFKTHPIHLSRYSSEEVAPGAGYFFFVIFAIFCADDFSSLLRH
jgi:hypothetical protein